MSGTIPLNQAAPAPIRVLDVARRVLAARQRPELATVSSRELHGATAVVSIEKCADGKTPGRLAKAQNDLDHFAEHLGEYGYLETAHAGNR